TRSSPSAENCADEQDVVIGVDGRHHLRRGRTEGAGSVDLLEPGVLTGRAVAAAPESVRGAGGSPVEIAAEDDAASGRATGQERRELGALRVVSGDLAGRAFVQMGG